MENIILKNNFLFMNNKDLLHYTNTAIINISYLVSFKYYNNNGEEEFNYPYIAFELSTKKNEKWFFEKYEDMVPLFEEIENAIQNINKPSVF